MLVTQAADKQKTQNHNQRLRAQVERHTAACREIVAESAQMKEVLRLVQRVGAVRHFGSNHRRIGNRKE